VRDGVYTAEQAKRGEAVYSHDCSGCHGPALEGGEALTPLAGREFVANWTGLTLDELFEKIRVSMPQDDPGRLTPQQTADVLAYILSANQLPTGKMELAQEKELLQQIRFEAP
jgi:mono/diheme cytochrome c family protein